MSESKKNIAAFDFDGTLVLRNTLIDFIFFSFGFWTTIFRFIPLLPGLLQYKLGKVSNEEAKTRLFTIFFKDMPAEKFKNLCQRYAEHLEPHVNTPGLVKLRWHQREGHEVVIVTASIEDWVKPWAALHHIEQVLGTKAEYQEGKLTGKFSTKNCYGIEKARRLQEHYPDLAHQTLWAYGDTEGDKEMLDLANCPFYRKFE